MGIPVADRFTFGAFATYRTSRLAAGITPNSVNREHAYLRAAFNKLRRLGICKKPNRLAGLRQFKIEEKEREYLTLEQISDLLEHLAVGSNRCTVMIAKVCLATGARWSEAENLELRHVRNAQIQFVGTKSRCIRTVPIEKQFEKDLKAHHDKKETSQRLFAVCICLLRISGRCGPGRHHASRRLTHTRTAPFVRITFHDGWRQYSGAATCFGSCEPDHDDALCAPCT